MASVKVAKKADLDAVETRTETLESNRARIDAENQFEVGQLFLTAEDVPSGQVPSYVTPAGSIALRIDDNGDISFGENPLDLFREFFYRADTRRLYLRSLFLHEVNDPVDLTLARGGGPLTRLSSGVTLPVATLAVDSTGAVTSAFNAAGTLDVGGQVVTYTGKTLTTFTGCSGGTGVMPTGTVVQQNNYPNGPLVAGITEGANLGAIGWRGSATVAGGDPGASIADGMAGSGDRSAAIIGRAAEDLFVGDAGTEIEIHTTAISDSAMLKRWTFTHAGTLTAEIGGQLRFKDSGGTDRRTLDIAGTDLNIAMDDGIDTVILWGRTRFFNSVSGNTEKFRITEDGLMRWFTGNTQTTVGAAGGASAPPATPTKWLRVLDDAGTTLVIPAYAS